MIINTYTFPLIVSGLFLIGIAFWALLYQTGAGARYMALLLLACATYSIGYAFEISSVRIEEILFWFKIEYIGISLLPAFLILFALSYANPDLKLSSSFTAALFIIPVLTLIFVYTNHYHNLFYHSVKMSMEEPFPAVVFERGPWYWVHAVYISSAVIFTNIQFILLLFKTSRKYKSQIILVLIGSFIPCISSAICQMRLIPWNLDMSPYAFTLSGLFIFWGLIHHHLLDILPVARTKLFEVLPDGVIILDNQQRIVDLNSVAKKYLNTKLDIIGRQAADVVPNWADFTDLFDQTETNEEMVTQWKLVNQLRWMKVESHPLQDRYGELNGYMILLRDITKRKQVEERLKLLATTDELTGLWNRRYLIQEIKMEMNRAARYHQTFSILMLDIDYFKEINDQYGHAAGDESLRILAMLLNKRLRQTDIVGRLGGEEFCLLLPETALDDAVALAETIRQEIANYPINYGKHEIYMTVSIGVTAYNDQIKDVDSLLKAVDDALYKAKNNGRNNIYRVS